MGGGDKGALDHLSTKERWLVRYLLCLAVLAFIGRTSPLSFLPLFMQNDFNCSPSIVGFIMASYPMAALVTTSWAARISRSCRRILTLHSMSIMFVSAAMFFTALAIPMYDVFGRTFAVGWIVFCRALQGMGMSLYLSSNTSAITRRFPTALPYIIALTEVAVGCGSQLGRIVGGFLFQFGGITLPYFVIGVLQFVAGLVGLFVFEDEKESFFFPAEKGTQFVSSAAGGSSKIPWSKLVTPRLWVGGFGPFMHYFTGTFFDAVGIQYLMVYLYPVTVGTLSLAVSFRGFVYLFGSYVIAQVMHKHLVSYERLMLLGAISGSIGNLLVAPQPFFSGWEASLEGTADPTTIVKWITVLVSFFLLQMGGALMFVPSLPLMQSEVRHHGTYAVEQVAEIFVTSMTLGEMVGPLFGGWLVGNVGFSDGTGILAFFYIPFLLLALLTYNGRVVDDRLKASQETMLLTPQDAKGHACGLKVTDGDSAFAARRMPFAIEEQRAERRRKSLPGTCAMEPMISEDAGRAMLASCSEPGYGRYVSLP